MSAEADEFSGTLMSRFLSGGHAKPKTEQTASAPATAVPAAPAAAPREFGKVDVKARKKRERRTTRTPKERERKVEKTKLINFKATDALAAELEALAVRLGTTKTAVIEMGIGLVRKSIEKGERP